MSAFTGFSPQGLRFLRDLAKHNDREWFVPRKHIYEAELLEPLRSLVADATAAFRKAKIPIAADPKRSTFRIYRDIRFSRDKSPYKTNLGAYLPRHGSNDSAGGVYIHIQPKGSFMAAGFYQIEKPFLERWRAGMAKKPKAFETALDALARNSLQLTEPEDTLKRMPRGYESHATSPIARYFRYASFITSEDLSDDDIARAALIERLVTFVRRARPLLDYGWNLDSSERSSK